MNREIKFRGKRVDNGEWIYGCAGYGFSGNMEYIMPKIYFATRDFGEEDKDGNPVIDDEIAIGGFIPVVPESVGQFTGLLDKSGKEVFEGDLFQVANNHIYQVKYLHGVSNHELYCGMFGLWLNEETFFPFDEYAMKRGEIIGNIYETELTNK